jgi:hypothetical protein
MKVLITSRSFRQQPGEHQRIPQQAGCECIESPINRPLAAEALIPLALVNPSVYKEKNTP